MLIAVAILTVATLAQTVAPGPDTSASEAVARAMADAVRNRFGAGAEVSVTDVTMPVNATTGHLDAVPDPGGRIGGRLGFSLVTTRRSGGRVQSVRIGRASAMVRVRLDQVRMRRFVARGMDVSADDVDVVRDEGGAILVRRLPTLAEVVGARALHDLPAGVGVDAAAVVLQPVVRAGDDVLVSATGPDFQVTATMKAVESGAAGAIIHVVNHDRHGPTLRVRIVSKGNVQILHD
jgi:flagella basal body P-ring formation protein FlgA